MDSSRFDRLARALGLMRTRRAAVAVVAAAVAMPGPGEMSGKGKHKRRKKKCAKACKDGCCTSKFGKCIKPSEQSTTRCGTGGGTCQSSGCTCSASLPCPSGQCCNGAGQCGACTVFASSTKGTGDIRGLAGADAECQRLANAAGLPGMYLAWLSDSNTSVASRFTKATVPYTLPGGQIVANNWADLTDGTLRLPINQTETGAVVTGTNQGAFRAWTFTTNSGGAGGADPNGICVNWTSGDGAPTGSFGEINSTTFWSIGGFQQCSVESRLYCFQQR